MGLQRGKDVSFGRIFDSGSCFSSPEIISLAIRLQVEQHIFGNIKPDPETPSLPKLLEKLFSLLRRVVKSILLGEIEGKSSEVLHLVREE